MQRRISFGMNKVLKKYKKYKKYQKYKNLENRNQEPKNAF